MSPQSCSAHYQWISLPTRVCTSKALHIYSKCRKGGRARAPESVTRKVLEMSLTLDKFTSGQVDVGANPSQIHLASLVCTLMRLSSSLSGGRIAQLDRRVFFLLAGLKWTGCWSRSWLCGFAWCILEVLFKLFWPYCGAADSYLSWPTFLQYVT